MKGHAESSKSPIFWLQSSGHPFKIARLLNSFRRFPSIRGVQKPSPLLVFFAVLSVVGIGGLIIWGKVSKQPGLQDVDAPLSLPESGDVDQRFQFLSAFQTAQIPLAVRFDPPLGTEHAGLVYNAQKFWEINLKRGGHHTGDDLNGIGGMNTDLGDPVFATADGLVIYVGEPSPGWGNLIVIAHKTADGRTLHSMYAHLHRTGVSTGSLVARGGEIGTVGTANGYYPAHLHFEMRASDGVDIGAGYGMFPLNRLDPMGTVTSLRNAAADDLSSSPLGTVSGR